MHWFIDSPEMELHMNMQALLISISMAVVILLTIMSLLRRIIFKMDLMDVIKAEHKNEMVKKLPKL